MSPHEFSVALYSSILLVALDQKRFVVVCGETVGFFVGGGNCVNPMTTNLKTDRCVGDNDDQSILVSEKIRRINVTGFL